MNWSKKSNRKYGETRSRFCGSSISFCRSEEPYHFDVSHSEQEDRFIDIGFSAFGRLLVVVYAEREDRIRIISSRLATPSGQSTYERANS
ncbi:MAG: BrnT family toxin [Anaerolineales bacterium]|uniref:BrnT family toxin n=1 Tax=Promineifilum sp. TaxID=2664178 RepID=UPI001D491456|nr:BrnT family toxin [Anaerolineales bacterium]